MSIYKKITEAEYMDKWKNTKILAGLYSQIKEEFVDKGLYTSVMAFVSAAVQEKLFKELPEGWFRKKIAELEGASS